MHLTTGFVWKLGMDQNRNVHSQDFGCFRLFLWHPKSSNRDPNFEPISPDGWWSWSLHHPHAHPAQQRRRARSVADLSWWRHGERLGDAGRHQNPKKNYRSTNQQLSKIPKAIGQRLDFLRSLREHFCYLKQGFLSSSLHSILGNLGDHQVYGMGTAIKCLKKHQPQPVSLWISGWAQSTKKHHLQTFSSRAALNQPGGDRVQSGRSLWRSYWTLSVRWCWLVKATQNAKTNKRAQKITRYCISKCDEHHCLVC